MKAGIVAIAGARTNSSLSTPRGTMSSFSGSLMPSISDCSRPNFPARFGPGPLLHPADDPALGPDHQQRAQHQEHEDDQDLQQHAATTGRGRSWPASGRRLASAGCASGGWRSFRAPHRCTEAAVTGARAARAHRRSRPSSSAARPPGRACPRSRTGHVICAAAGGHGDLTAIGRAGLRRGRRRHPRDGGAGGPGQVRLAVLHPAGVEQMMPGGEHAPRPGAGPARPARARPRRPPAGAGRGPARPAAAGPARPSVGELAAGRGGVGQAEVHVHLVGDRASTCRSAADRRNRAARQRTSPAGPPSSRTCPPSRRRRRPGGPRRPGR